MKSDPLTGTLVGVLAVSVLASIFFFYQYVSTTRDIRQSQIQLMNINARRQAINALLIDVVEYSKTHPAIDPILQDANIKPKTGAAAPAPAPTIKPAGK